MTNHSCSIRTAGVTEHTIETYANLTDETLRYRCSIKYLNRSENRFVTGYQNIEYSKIAVH